MADGRATPWLRGYPTGLAVVSGGLYALAQPERGAWFLSPICLVPLLLAARGRSPWTRFFLGWLSGTFAAAFVLEPVGVALASFFGWSSALGFVASLGLGQIFGALPLGLFAVLGLSSGEIRGWAALLRPGAALVVCEWLRSHFFGGAAWGLLAYAAAPRPELAQGAAWGGSALVTFLLVCANVSIFELAVRRFARALVLGVATSVVASLAAMAAAGTRAAIQTVDELPAQVGPEELRIAVVQGALPLAARRGIDRVVRDTRRLASQSAIPNADLVIWSESAFSLVLPENLHILNDAFGPADAPPALLLGAPRGATEGPPYNSALLIQNGAVSASYDKVFLVPFAETTPRPLRWMSRRSPKRSRGTRLVPLPVGSQRLGVAICYDVLFAGAIREQVRQGATLVVNLSNDEWFGGTRGVEQHVAASILRAIENRRPTLRATNTGVTTVMDPYGRQLSRLPMDQPGRILAVLGTSGPQAFYTRFGDWPVWASFGLLAGFALRRARPASRPLSNGPPFPGSAGSASGAPGPRGGGARSARPTPRR